MKAVHDHGKSKEVKLWYKEGHKNTVRRGFMLVAQGLMEIVTNEPRKSLLDNISDTAVNLQNCMNVVVETDMHSLVRKFVNSLNLNKICKVVVGEKRNFK